MRVVAGSARGRRLVAPKGDRTRPTSDRVKEAWFSSLAPRLVGASVLDLFAGSGALGIEALSRGAAHATFVDSAAPAVRAVRTNLEVTGLSDRADVITNDVVAALRGTLPAAPFDVVVADPPYGLDRQRLATCLQLLMAHLAPDAVIVVEQSAREPQPPWPDAVRHDRTRKYGDTALHTAVVQASTGAADGPAKRNP